MTTKATPSQVKAAYARALAAIFDLKQKDIKKDIHTGKKAPGQWSPDSTLEIYCEGDIPNASDYHSFADFGLEGYYCHAEKWCEVDKVANKLLVEKLGENIQSYWHEPYNNAVVTVWPST